MTSQFVDFTADFKAGVGNLNIDVTGWDWVTVQIITPSSAISFKTTNDDGSVSGAVSGNAKAATNWLTCQGIDLSSGSGVTSVSASANVRFPVVGRFIQLSSSAATAVKVLIYYSKIH